MSSNRKIEINAIEETTVKRLLDTMYADKGAYVLHKAESTIIVCMEDDNNYILVPNYAVYFAINPSKLALRLQLREYLGTQSDDDKVQYSKLNENRTSLVDKCFPRDKATENDHRKKPGLR